MFDSIWFHQSLWGQKPSFSPFSLWIPFASAVFFIFFLALLDSHKYHIFSSYCANFIVILLNSISKLPLLLLLWLMLTWVRVQIKFTFRVFVNLDSFFNSVFKQDEQSHKYTNWWCKQWHFFHIIRGWFMIFDWLVYNQFPFC